MNYDAAEELAEKLGLEIAHKLQKLFPKMKPGWKAQVVELYGLNFDSVLSSHEQGDKSALLSARFRREICFVVAHYLIESGLDITSLDGKNKTRPHSQAKGALHFVDDRKQGDGHILRIKIEKLEGLGTLMTALRYPLLVLERLTAPKKHEPDAETLGYIETRLAEIKRKG